VSWCPGTLVAVFVCAQLITSVVLDLTGGFELELWLRNHHMMLAHWWPSLCVHSSLLRSCWT
jgi:uncharacterized membrane protein YdcZ (DUF606 family)